MLDFTVETPAARNVEVKLKVEDLQRLGDQVRVAGARPVTTLWQRDTYFQVPRGRLKLREETDLPATLIWYDRANEAASRLCRYHLMQVPEPARVKEAFREAFGVRVVVSKSRELLLYENVRVHLDRVEDLGEFLELEAVLAPDEPETAGQAIVRRLLDALGLANAPVLTHSYADLLLDKNLRRSLGG